MYEDLIGLIMGLGNWNGVSGRILIRHKEAKSQSSNYTDLP